LNQEIQASTQSKISMACTPKDSLSSASLNLLSQLLLQPVVEVVEGNRLIHLKCIHPPNDLWHYRTMTDLAKKRCPPLQSKNERQYIVYKVRYKNNIIHIFFEFIRGI